LIDCPLAGCEQLRAPPAPKIKRKKLQNIDSHMTVMAKH